MNRSELTDLKYPNDFADELTKRWIQLQPRLSPRQTAPTNKASGSHVILRAVESSFPEPEILRELLGILYHVGFLAEESRKLAVRLAYLSPEDFKSKAPGDQLIHNPPLVFSHPRPFTSTEVMRLAPALDSTRSVMAVFADSKYPLAIWGILHLGEDWWRLTTGRGTAALVPPRCLMLSTFAPGNITATVAGMVLLRLEKGKFSHAPLQGLGDGPIGRFFQRSADRFYQKTLKTLGIQKFSQKPDEDGVPARLYYQVFENILRFAAEHRHGATFVVFADEIETDDQRLRQLVDLKYVTGSPRIWPELLESCVAYRRYFDLMFPQAGGSLLQNDNASASELKEMNIWKGIWEEKQREMIGLESFVAGLSGVDGAVVLSTRFKLVGFGGEIVVRDGALRNVKRAEDSNATKSTLVPIDSMGTRHRSAFRLCSSFEDCLVLVVSQDGGAKAVKKVERDVVFWDNVDVRPYAL